MDRIKSFKADALATRNLGTVFIPAVENNRRDIFEYFTELLLEKDYKSTSGL